MGAGRFRILFLADSHLGFDLPLRPRVERRRRGLDFFANFERVLSAALDSEVDLIVHGGDVFYRSRVPPELVQRVFLPLKRIADAGIPIYLVPGNHERSKIPYPMLAEHPGINIFDRPRTFALNVRGVTLALAGFPYCRHDVRGRFSELVGETQWQTVGADVSLLCIHHCFEGATVGPHDYTFRYASDVVCLSDVPETFVAVLTGHIHRHQALTTDLQGSRIRTPVLYPGSIERTAFAEMGEPKGYLLIEFERAAGPGFAVSWEFRTLPARPMVVENVDATGVDRQMMESRLRHVFGAVSQDAVLRLRVRGTIGEGARKALAAANLRELVPQSMNVDVVLVDEVARRQRS